MSSTATAADEFKLNFFNSTVALMQADPDKQEVQVTYGYPGVYDSPDMIEFADVGSTQKEGPFSGTNRSRDETLTLTIIITCFRGGLQDMEQVCASRCYELLRMIETFARVTDTTIGGAVKWCFLTSHNSIGHTAPEVLERGRAVELTATFTAEARISTY